MKSVENAKKKGKTDLRTNGTDKWYATREKETQEFVHAE